MLILLAAIFVLHIIGIILLLVATIDNAWWMTDTIATDVWARWELANGVWNYTDLPTGSHYPTDYLQAVQASSVLACIFSILGIFVFVAQLFTLPKGQRFTISGIFQLLSCEFVSLLSLSLSLSLSPHPQRSSALSLSVSSLTCPCLLPSRPEHHDRSLHLHGPLPPRRERRLVRAQLHPGVDRILPHIHLLHHLLCAT
uniref:Epithelial membrane protein 2 n=1 Tax=Gasterosteus aculeatus aculeatus TaxID=481459 RepID=A0AAQ4PHI2_GASAC